MLKNDIENRNENNRRRKIKYIYYPNTKEFRMVQKKDQKKNFNSKE